MRVRSRGKSFETVADSDGAFAFYDLPRGTYEFDPDLPPGTTLYWYIGGEKHLRPVDLDGAGCRKENIEVFSSGSIEGRVLGSNNQPFSEVSVYLVPVSTLDLSNRWRLYWESQSKQGVFKFVHVPPGEYLVLVNPEDSTTDNFPYRRTFHPGVHDRSEAGVITVSPGQQVNNVDIQLR